MEDNKDQGMNVREKSKQLVSLLKDDERLRQERMRALKAKERFAQNTNVAAAESGTRSFRSFAHSQASLVFQSLYPVKNAIRAHVVVLQVVLPDVLIQVVKSSHHRETIARCLVATLSWNPPDLRPPARRSCNYNSRLP